MVGLMEARAASPAQQDQPAAQKGNAQYIDVRNLTADDVRAALERAGGVPDKAWRDLGLANRHVLKRLVKKFGLRDE